MEMEKRRIYKNIAKQVTHFPMRCLENRGEDEMKRTTPRGGIVA